MLLIDDAPSASGGILSALPMNLPENDRRRKTFLGQWIYAHRVLVFKVHALDKSYGSALDTLSGEVSIPRYLEAPEFNHIALRRRWVDFQHDYIITNSSKETHIKILENMKEKGTTRAEKNGQGLYGIYIRCRFRLVGGTTIFITPDPDNKTHNLETNRPSVVAVPKPRWENNASALYKEWQGRVEEANMWKMRAEQAEEENESLKQDIEFLQPDYTWEHSDKASLLEKWKQTMR